MQNNLDTITWLLDKARALGADAADAVMFETVDISTSRRLGNPEGLERSESRAVGLRAFSGQQQAMASSTDISRSALEELAVNAVAMAKAAPPDPDAKLAPQSLQAKEVAELDLLDNNEPTSVWLDEQCKVAEEAARAVKGVTNSEGADAYFGKSTVSLATSDGGQSFAKSYSASHFSLSVSVIAGTGTDMQRDYDFSSTRHRSDLLSAAAIGKNAGELAVKRLHPKKVATCKVPVVIDPRVSRGLLGVLAGAISGNAVARGSSFLKDAMGTMVFSKGITIVDDPHIVARPGFQTLRRRGR